MQLLLQICIVYKKGLLLKDVHSNILFGMVDKNLQKQKERRTHPQLTHLPSFQHTLHPPPVIGWFTQGPSPLFLSLAGVQARPLPSLVYL